MFHHTRLGIAAVPLARQVLQGVLHRRLRSIRAIGVDSQLGRQFVGRLEADATDVVGELVWVLFNLGDGLLAVGAIDTDRPSRRDAMLSQEQDDLADLLLLLPALTDAFQ